MVFAQCKSREGCFRLYQVAGRGGVDWMGEKECRPDPPSSPKIQHERPDQRMRLRTGVSPNATRNTLRCSRVGVGRGHWTEVVRGLDAAALTLGDERRAIYDAFAIASKSHSSRRHYGLARRRSSIARRSSCMAFLQHVWTRSL